MNVVHGAWIPDETDEFVQGGAFYLWVETDTPTSTRKCDDGTHPRQLAPDALEAFLKDTLGLRDGYQSAISRDICTKWFLLPSFGGAPLPSFELLRYVGDEHPETFELQPWRMHCYRLPNVIASLNDIHFMALHGADEYQLGTDFLFWYHVAQALKALIARDHFIPALKCRALAPAPTKGKRAAPSGSYELFPAWQMIAEKYDAAIRDYAAVMPAVCTAVAEAPDSANGFYAREALLRHFAEHMLYDIVVGTPFTAKFEQQVSGTLVYNCVFPYRPDTSAWTRTPGPTLDDYKQWAAWRDKLTRAQTTAACTLCFLLQEAPGDDADNWRVHFLAASKRDPSLKISLDDYWHLDKTARNRVLDHFGRDFEKDVLLALGYAARIYPKVWDGLETDRPAELRLTLEEAFTFLKESAWVLEDAGYIVIVPSWWTPQGRRRAKIRLKTAARPAKGTSPSGAGHGYFSLDAIFDYQAQLSIGGQVVSDAEWRALVNAKTPLVQFRGQWMELDRDKMRQMLELWQSREQGQQEMSLLDLMRVAAESEDDVEWEHDRALQQMMARLHDKSAFTPIENPPALHGSLREYQKRGVAWLRYLESLGLNPCLADDMGLGKSIQVIAHLVNERDEHDRSVADDGDGQRQIAPTLLIAPTSVLGNWRKEIERFAPQLRTLVHHGSGRIKQEAAFKAACRDHDVVITSFALARLDEKLLRGPDWRRVVVDEAQNIKNPQSAQARAIVKLPARHRMALTGTPVENRLLDLWSIFNFLNPGYLGKEAQFRKTFETPIQKNNDLARSATLKKLVEPFILRRVKTDKSIIDDLPDKIEQKVYCNLTT